MHDKNSPQNKSEDHSIDNLDEWIVNVLKMFYDWIFFTWELVIDRLSTHSKAFGGSYFMFYAGGGEH